MKPPFLPPLAFLLLLLISGYGFAQDESSLEENGWHHFPVEDDGIVLYHKKGEGDAYLYKASATISAILPEVDALWSEVESYPEWVPGFARVEALSPEPDSSYSLYVQARTPAFPPNRDFVVNLAFSRTSDAIIGRFTNRAAMKPEVKGFLRVPVLSGFVVARQVTPDSCKVTFQCEVDLGGKVAEATVDAQMWKVIAVFMHVFSGDYEQIMAREGLL